MTTQKSLIRRLFSKIAYVINAFRRLIVNVVFFSLLAVFVIALLNGQDEVEVEAGSALVLNLHGEIVEQKKSVDPMSTFLNDAVSEKEANPEILLADIIKVIKHAKSDSRIELLVLDLKRMSKASITQLAEIASEIESFKKSGKLVYAIGDQYSQNQYYLASYADEIWLDPKGWLLLDGYARYSLYFKSALDKLKISQHIFRVGTYKSAVEPFMRNSMSAEAKRANKAWLTDLWSYYKNQVAEQRGFAVSNFDESASKLITKLTKADGNFAEYALNNQWVDKLKTREQSINDIAEIVGFNKKKTNFKQVSFNDYYKATTPVIDVVNPKTDKVAIVVAKGTIYNGTQKAGNIGGDSTAKLLKRARLNDNVKAVVLRVDSPGGSAFASEIIRREIDLLKAAGKPVVASMGTYAASGGYWISAPANKIYAAPTTITGSIGIFGLFMTFENSLNHLGINADGVGTTEFAGFGPTRKLNPNMGKIIQLNIDRGYQDFIGLVAKNRKMTLEQVDKVAQGRVWSGVKAKELGLVDELGSFQDAIFAAAKLAGLDINFDTLLVEKELSAKEQFLKDLFGNAAKWLPALEKSEPTPADIVIKQLMNEYGQLNSFNDPQGVYSMCLPCQISH